MQSKFSIGWRVPNRKTTRQRSWRTLNAIVAVSVLVNVCGFGLFGAPQAAAALDSGAIAPNQTLVSNAVTSPDNAWVSDNNRAIFGASTDTADYGFANIGVPVGATITGIQVTLEGLHSSGFNARTLTTALWNTSGSTPDAYTTVKTASSMSTSSNDNVSTLGGASDLWGKTWTDADFASGTFKLRIGVSGSNGSAQLDQVLIKVYFTPACALATQGNQVSNGDFEIASGDPTLPMDWVPGYFDPLNITPTFTYPVAGNPGKAANVQVSAYTAASGEEAKWLFTPVTTCPGKTFDISIGYTSNVLTSVWVAYQMSNGTTPNPEWVADAPASAAWSTVTGQITIPAGVASFQVFQSLAAVGSLTIDAVSVKPLVPFPEGMVTLNFDDTFASQYTVAPPILSAANLKASFFAITDSSVGIGSDSNYMTWANVAALNAAGHEIGAHTRTHPDLSLLTPEQAQIEIAGSKTDLVNHGLTPTTFVYPYGVYNAAIIQMVKDAGFTSARSVVRGFNYRTSNKYALLDQQIINTTTVAEVQGWIDQAKANKTWLILELHEQTSTPGPDTGVYYNTPTRLQEIVTAIKNSGIKVVTQSEGTTLINPVITVAPYVLTPTNQDITVTATTDSGTLNATSHLFTANGSFDFIATDENGNSTTKTVTITNIDKVAPVVTIAPYTLTPTNQDITVAASTNEGTLNTTSHVFTVNSAFDFIATDAAGNVTTQAVTVTNIDKTAPIITLDPYNTALTNSDITVTAHTNEGTLNVASHTFTLNGSFDFVATDAAGNVTTQTVTINNIDRIAPAGTISYNTTAPTNGHVVATLLPNKSVTVTNNGGLFTHVFTTNGSFTFTFVDEANNTGSAMAIVSNIDTTAPVITLTPYNTAPTNTDITVFATTNEGSLNATAHTFSANGAFTFVATDAAGNSTSQAVTISNLNKVKPVITLIGSATITLTKGAAYSDAGATATDDVDGDISIKMTAENSVNTAVVGTYAVRYTVTDSAGNVADPVTRTVNVEAAPQVLGATTFHPIIKTIKPVKGVYSYKLNGKTIKIQPFGSDYKGVVWGRSIDFGTSGKIYVFLNAGAYKKGQIKVYQANGKLLKSYSPYGGFALSGLNASIVSESNDQVYLVVGTLRAGTTVKTYQVTAKKLTALNGLVTTTKSGNVQVSFQKLYKGQYGLVTMKLGDRKTLKVWKLNFTTKKFVEDKKISKTKLKI